MRYIPKKNRTHGDFKLENIMVNPKTGELQLIDFDFSRQYLWIPAFRGSPTYAAPEVCLPILFPESPYLQINPDDDRYYVHRNADDFTAGVVLSILVGIVNPWETRSDLIQTYWNIMKNHPEAINDKQICNEYRGVLKAGITILT